MNVLKLYRGGLHAAADKKSSQDSLLRFLHRYLHQEGTGVYLHGLKPDFADNLLPIAAAQKKRGAVVGGAGLEGADAKLATPVFACKFPVKSFYAVIVKKIL